MRAPFDASSRLKRRCGPEERPRPTPRAAASGLEEKVAFLADPRRYRGRPDGVETIETHFAWVFLVGERAYKLKKPVRRASMNYSTLARRERACREELELNRRLAPGVYLRVVPLGRDRHGALIRGGGVRVVDWLVEMVRLPEARRLDRAIRTGAIGPGDLEPVVTRLATFFQRAERRPMSDRRYLARLRHQVLCDAQALLASDLLLDRCLVEEVCCSQLAFLEECAPLLAGRGERLRDGHGDLRPEHVFLGDRGAAACVIDCLEFDRNLRRLDPAEEMAFLALECRRLGAAGIADELMARYARATGDPAPRSLSHFYMGRRAAVRALIAAWHLRDPAFSEESGKWSARAHSYLRDALRHTRRALPRHRDGRINPPALPASAPGEAPRVCP